jgi:transposase
MLEGQLQLSLLESSEAKVPQTPPISESETEEISYKRKKRKGKREEDLSGLPVERIDHELLGENRGCPECGESMKDIGIDVRRELKLIPAQVVVVEHATHAYACHNKECQEVGEGTIMVKADAPTPLISGSLASPSLVAHIAVQKYANGTPLYRIEKGFLYDGVIVTRQNMANWVIKCAEMYLTAIYSLLIKFLLLESVLHADETTVQVLREPGRNPQSKSYEWVYRTSGHSKHKIAIYDYKETRKREHPKEFLKNFKGWLHCDGYEVYHGLWPDITIVGCFAHARRYFEKILKSIPENERKGTDAERGVTFISRLFDLERTFKNLSPEERYLARLEKSKPIADELFALAENLNALPKSPLGQAAHYALSQRKYLENVFLDGRLELSNNRAERSVKPFVIGRNYVLKKTMCLRGMGILQNPNSPQTA